MKLNKGIRAWIVLAILLAAQLAMAAERGGEKVRIAVSSKSLGFFDTWAARERGFYRNHGLDPEIIAMRPPVAAAALQAGEIDYNFGASTTLRASISGLPVKVVSLSVRSSFHTLTSKSSIKSMADLKGKVIAVTIGAADDVVVRHLVRRGGLDPRDVTFISMAGSDSRYQSLLAGSIDATALSLPFFIVAKRQGFNLLGTAVDVLEMATVGIGTSTRKIQQEREQVKKMVRRNWTPYVGSNLRRPKPYNFCSASLVWTKEWRPSHTSFMPGLSSKTRGRSHRL